jgi:hypothetical protein
MGILTMVVAMAFSAAGPAVSPRSPAAGLAGRTFPAGLSLRALPERPLRAPLAPTSSYDPDRTADKFAEFSQAAALPEASGRTWQDVGPHGVDNPPGYAGSAEQFQKIAGMVSALVVDSTDPTGNTVYMGNMGGLWRSTDAGDHWQNISDGKIPSAAVGAIALDPAHPGDIYVGTGITYLTLSGDAFGTGFYVSHDYGDTFTRPSPNVSGWAVSVIRAGTGGVLVGTNHGLYVSTDRGDHVSPVSLPDNATHDAPAVGPYANWITDIAVRPNHPDEVTVAVGFYQGKVLLADGSIAAPGNGLYRSTTGPSGPYTFMGSTSQLASPEASTDPIGRISLAYGQTANEDAVLWAFVSDAGLVAGQSEVGDRVPNQGGTELNGLFRSGDDGSSWTVKVTPTSLLTAPNSTLTPYETLGYAPGVQASYELWVATDPNVPDQVYFGLEEAYQTVFNAGAGPGLAFATVIERYADLCGFYLFFANLTNGYPCPDGTPLYGGFTTHPDQHAVATAKLADGVTRLFSGNDGGAFRQDSHSVPTGGRFDNDHWTQANSVPTLQPWHVAMLPGGEIVAGLQDNGASLNGADRQGVQIGLGDGYFVIPTENPDVFYVSIAGGALFITTDHGHNLREMQPELTGAAFTSPIALDPTDHMHIVAAAQNVEETLRGPDTQTVSDPLLGTVISTDWTESFASGNGPTGVPWNATALDVRGAAIYAAMCDTCRVIAENFDDVHTRVETNVQPGCEAAKGSSACWHLASANGLGAGYISKLVIDPTDPNTIFVSIIERQFVGYPTDKVPGRVFVSHDAGENFADVTGNLPHGSVWGLVIHDGQLIAASDTGMFTAPAGTSSWSRLGLGLPATQVRDAWLDPTGQFLLVSAYGRGVWMLNFGAPSEGGSNSPGPQAPLPNTAAVASAGGVVILPLAGLLVSTLVAWRRRRRRGEEGVRA